MGKKRKSLDLEHLGLIAAAFAASVAAVRVLAVCRWDPQTAYVFLQEQGTTAALTGTLLDVVPLGILYFLTGVVYFGLPDRDENRARFAVLLILLILALTVAVFSLPLIGLLLLLLLFFAAYRVEQRIKKIRQRPPPPPPISMDVLAVSSDDTAEQAEAKIERMNAEIARIQAEIAQTTAEQEANEAELRQMQADNRRTEPRLFAAVGLFVLAPMLLSSTPWLPLEQVGGDNPTVGWVLSQSEHQMVVLERDPRRAIQLPPDTPHRYCVLRPGTGWWYRTAEVLGEPALVTRLLIGGAARGHPCQLMENAPPEPDLRPQQGA